MTPTQQTLFDIPETPEPRESLPFQPHSETSRAAADSMKEVAGKCRLEVFNAIAAHKDGLTDEECQDDLGMNPSTQRPRRIELLDAGRIIANGKRKTKSGRMATVWTVNPTV